MDAVVFSLAFAVAAFAALVVAARVDRRISLAFAWLCALYLGLDDLVTGLPTEFASLRIDAGSWNWAGKIYSLLLSVAVLGALRIAPEAVGLTLKHRNVRSSLVALGLFVLWGLTLGFVFDPGIPSAETLVFQALMPGLSEELVYRGIAPALLLGLVYGRQPEPGIPWTVVIVTSLVFGLWHGLGYSNGHFTFDAMSALFPFIGSLAGGWLRFHSGSLLFPVLAHGIANLAFHLAPLLGR